MSRRRKNTKPDGSLTAWPPPFSSLPPLTFPPFAPSLAIASAVMFQTAVGLTLTISKVETSAANALVLFSLSPLWGAVGAWLLLSEPLPRRTIVATMVGVCCAVAVYNDFDIILPPGRFRHPGPFSPFFPPPPYRPRCAFRGVL